MEAIYGELVRLATEMEGYADGSYHVHGQVGATHFVISSRELHYSRCHVQFLSTYRIVV